MRLIRCPVYGFRQPKSLFFQAAPVQPIVTRQFEKSHKLGRNLRL